MTSSQTFRIYEILSKHFQNPEEAKVVAQEIEQIVENKFQEKKETLAAKSDIMELKVDMVDRIHKAKIETIIWIVGVGVLQVIAGLLLKKFG